MRDGVATSLIELASRSDVIRSIVDEISKNSLRRSKLPALDLFDWCANAAEFFCRGVEQNAPASERRVHWVLLYSNRFTSHVIDVSHLTRHDFNPEVKSIEAIVVVNFGDVFKSLSRLYAAIEWPTQHGPDVLSSLILVDILSRLDFRRDDRLFNGVLLSLGPNLRFARTNEIRDVLDDPDSEYVAIYGRIFGAFIVCHEFAHLMWRIHPFAATQFKQWVAGIIQKTIDGGHNFECFLGDGFRGFDVELEIEPALRELLTVRSDNVDEFVERLDFEELFCDRQAIHSLVKLIVDDGIFDGNTSDQVVQHLAKIRVCFEYISLYNSSISQILAVLEDTGAMVRINDRRDVSVEEQAVIIKRMQHRSYELAGRAVIRSFLGERMLDAEIVNQVEEMTDGMKLAVGKNPDGSERTELLANTAKSLYLSIVRDTFYENGVCWRNGISLQKIKSDFGELDRILVASALGSAQKIASEYYEHNPDEDFFDFFSYYIVGTASFR